MSEKMENISNLNRVWQVIPATKTLSFPRRNKAMYFDEESHVPYYQQIYNHFHQGITEGLYPEGGKLPSIRGLADELRCSRNTVEAAYQMLAEEGFVASKPGSGYVIQCLDHIDAAPLARHASSSMAAIRIKRTAVRYDFTYGNLQKGTFPALTWRSLADDILLSTEAQLADIYTDPIGERPLRAEIAWRLSVARGITCTPENVIVQGGTQPSIDNLLALFDPACDTMAMEEPGYDAVRSVFERNRFNVAYCRFLDNEEDFVADVMASNAKLVYLTPSSQFPTARVLSVPMRKRLIEWAQAEDAYILEDDYCREFRYHERALPPLHSMDPEHVIYMGTFSKSLSPALRINYLVMPSALSERWKNLYSEAYPAVPWLSQAVLTRFLRDGHRDRHLRKLQTQNKRKYETLVKTLHEAMGEHVEVMENGTGLHVLVNVLDGRPQEELVRAALERNVRVYETNRYWSSRRHPLASCVLLGFSAIPEEDIQPGICELARAWFRAQ